MRILGIIDGAHDAGSCIVQDGKVIAAISEERLTRIKMMGSFPSNSIQALLKITNLGPEDINCIAVGSILTPQLYFRTFRGLVRIARLDEGLFHVKHLSLKTWLADFIQFRSGITGMSPSSFLGRMEIPLMKLLIKKDLPPPLRKKPIFFVEHHLSHAASAYFTWDKERTLCVTCDGVGDGICMAVYMCEDGKIQRIYSVPYPVSFGFLYSMLTGILDFRPFRHEGKLTGLAAYGNPEAVDIPFPFKKTGDRVIFTERWGIKGNNYFKRFKGYNREDVSAWLQTGIENIVVEIVKEWVEKTQSSNLCLAGGLFANVRLNQKIHSLCNLDSIYIFPHMGDGGLCVGGALQAWAWATQKKGKTPHPSLMEDVFLGPIFSDEEIKNALDRSGLKYKKCDNIEMEVAKILTQDKIVGRFDGRMEFGPRALGNRTILSSATNPQIKDILNRRLRRTEFMPFAPCTLWERAKDCYTGIEGAEHTAQFMNISFQCTDFMRAKSPGAIHVDNSARPQLVKPSHKSFYCIIDEYYKLTGIPTLINTSFNIHEEPIVCTPEDALKTFDEGKIDFLAIGNYLAWKREAGG